MSKNDNVRGLKKTVMKAHNVYICYVPDEKAVYNWESDKLEVSGGNNFIVLDPAGGFSIRSYEYIAERYRINEDKVISKSWLSSKTISVRLPDGSDGKAVDWFEATAVLDKTVYYAVFKPKDDVGYIPSTTYGKQFYNRPDIEHDNGDFILIPSDETGALLADEAKVINGNLFPKMYNLRNFARNSSNHAKAYKVGTPESVLQWYENGGTEAVDSHRHPAIVSAEVVRLGKDRKLWANALFDLEFLSYIVGYTLYADSVKVIEEVDMYAPAYKTIKCSFRIEDGHGNKITISGARSKKNDANSFRLSYLYDPKHPSLGYLSGDEDFLSVHVARSDKALTRTLFKMICAFKLKSACPNLKTGKELFINGMWAISTGILDYNRRIDVDGVVLRMSKDIDLTFKVGSGNSGETLQFGFDLTDGKSRFPIQVACVNTGKLGKPLYTVRLCIDKTTIVPKVIETSARDISKTLLRLTMQMGAEIGSASTVDALKKALLTVSGAANASPSTVEALRGVLPNC